MIKTVLKIDGIMCGMCESHINDCIRRTFDVKKVTSSHSKGETVIVSASALDEEKLRKAIAETGYELKNISVCEEGLETEKKAKKGLFGGLFGKK